jgi:bacterioferritin-associated ferredoxin
MNDIPPDLLKKYPYLAQVEEALQQYRDGGPVIAQCGECGHTLTVTLIDETAELWVTCPNGHIHFRAKHEKS